MSKLNVDQRTIMSLLQESNNDFLIPDYQRPYAWGETECRTLWDDLFAFSFPDNDQEKFDRDSDKYFLGPIVTFRNEQRKLEVIDGQQRLTTLLLLLRAFYEKFGNMKDRQSEKTMQNLERCIWKTDELGEIDHQSPKLVTLVATDDDRDEFAKILAQGQPGKEMRSNYAQNYRFFQGQIDDFLTRYPGYFLYFPNRIMNNCLLLPVEADNQDTALRIFSTLNDRGLPLSDSDIFKAKLYKIYSREGDKDLFIESWRKLEEKCAELFGNSPMDELFLRYMYYERALLGIKLSTTEGLRKFFESNQLIEKKGRAIMDNLVALADFWNDVSSQSKAAFSERNLRQLFILNYSPNSMWANALSVYFLCQRDGENCLDEGRLYDFLSRLMAFTFAYSITNPGVNALRTPVYAEMLGLVQGSPANFSEFKFDRQFLERSMHNFEFLNGRPITKAILTWWAFSREGQGIFSLGESFDIEHIFARKRFEIEGGLNDQRNLECLGNKSLLEKRINIRASDYQFETKRKFYRGEIQRKRGEPATATRIIELLQIAQGMESFTEQDIEERNERIISAFLEFLDGQQLINWKSMELG